MEIRVRAQLLNAVATFIASQAALTSSKRISEAELS